MYTVTTTVHQRSIAQICLARFAGPPAGALLLVETAALVAMGTTPSAPSPPAAPVELVAAFIKAALADRLPDIDSC